MIFLEGWVRAIVSQTNIGTVSKATLGSLLRDGVALGFSEHIDTILNWTVLLITPLAVTVSVTCIQVWLWGTGLLNTPYLHPTIDCFTNVIALSTRATKNIKAGTSLATFVTGLGLSLTFWLTVTVVILVAWTWSWSYHIQLWEYDVNRELNKNVTLLGQQKACLSHYVAWRYWEADAHCVKQRSWI